MISKTTPLAGAVARRLPQQPSPWQDEQGALAFIDPLLPEALGVDLVTDLLRTAAGEVVTEHRSITDQQFDLLSKHRSIPLIPDHWTCPPGRREETLRSLLFLGMSLKAATFEAVGILEDNGIETVVLKGTATSRLDYPRPELRHSGDVDLLVDDAQRALAVSVLKSNGYTLNAPRNFDPEFEKGYDLVSPSGIQVDIHSRICHTSNNCPKDMLADAEPIPELNASALPVEARLVHAAAHFFFGPPQHRRLSGFADITAILARQSPPDIDVTREAARSLGLEQETYAALAAEAILTGKDASAYSKWEQPSGLLHLAYSRPKRLRLAEQLYIASAFDGTRNRLRYLTQKAVPGKEFLEHRGGLAEYARGRTRN